MNRKDAAARRAERGGKPLKPTKVAGEKPTAKTDEEVVAAAPSALDALPVRSTGLEEAVLDRAEDEEGSVDGEVAKPTAREVVGLGSDSATVEPTDGETVLNDILPMPGGQPLLYVVLKARVTFKSKPIEVLDVTDSRHFMTHAIRLSGGMLWFDVEIPGNRSGRFVGCVPIADVKVALYSRPA